MEKAPQKRFAELLIVGALIGAVVGVAITRHGWHPTFFSGNINHFDYDVEWNRVTPSVILWFAFSMYWSFAARNSAPSKTSESRPSTYFHQFVLNGALILLIWPAPHLTGWFLPQRFHFFVLIGVIVQSAFISLALSARRHLGRNWSAEVRIGEGHQLVRTGPYRYVRHPIYTAMLGMFLGTAIASSQYHALIALAALFLAYLRKSHLEDEILRQSFGPEFDVYKQDTWSLIPGLY